MLAQDNPPVPAAAARPATRADAPVGDLARGLIRNIARAFIGKDEVVSNAVLALISGGHVLLEDVPGLGKTLLAKAIAKSLSANFKRVQFTADLLPSDITGVTIFNADRHEFNFRPGPIFTHVLLGDEINRATPRTQSSLLEAMEEQSVTVDGTLHPLASPFFVIATQNPVELEGTYPLPFAQMDRFMVRLSIGYLDKAAEMRLLRLQQHHDPLDAVEPVMDCPTLQQLQSAVRRVVLNDLLLGYLVEIVQATRRAETLEYGASPRGSLDLQRFAQALACLANRDYVLPDDIKHAARLILPHRLIARKGTRSVSAHARSVVDHIVDSVPVPI